MSKLQPRFDFSIFHTANFPVDAAQLANPSGTAPMDQFLKNVHLERSIYEVRCKPALNIRAEATGWRYHITTELSSNWGCERLHLHTFCTQEDVFTNDIQCKQFVDCKLQLGEMKDAFYHWFFSSNWKTPRHHLDLCVRAFTWCVLQLHNVSGVSNAC